eukprot:CAMPEP_0168749498 /NCGR_PEP_ID=MMETSP0724-20121128/16748_1 /TAXON_ID=265536 /ORGANISM="Amphiprora sp., Strain CCMP467" /LENGTH=1442 /DNA_ID=CAMNT_0008797411 /DNA_START=144 /DNA_END=4472 /DNA_ORIENTATION=-
MNVEEALNTATELEHQYGVKYGQQHDAMDNFGHPESPQLALHGLSQKDANSNENIHLLIVYTKHCIAAQMLSSSNDENGGTKGGPLSQAIHVGSLIPEQHDNENTALERSQESDEIITCLRIFELENPAICSNSLPTPSKSATRFIIAVTLGTNQSRLFTAELTIVFDSSSQEWSIENSSSRHAVSLLEVLPVDNRTVAESIRRKNKGRKASDDKSPETIVPFQPSGGLSSMYCRHDMNVNPMEQETTYVWITYADGTIVRVHHAALFPCVWAEGVDAELSVDDLLLRFKHTALVRYQVRLPPGEEQNVAIVPLPKYFASPFAPVNSEEMNNQHEALVFGKTDSMPTLCVYSSEDQFWEPQPTKTTGGMVDVVLGGTKAIVGGVVGALRWATSSEQSSGVGSSSDEPEELPSTPFPSIWRLPMSLFAGSEFHDLPRIVEHCAIDPDGQHAAFCDGLGRVLLMDLTTKQIIRMWKGLRLASCTWIRESSSVEESAKTRGNTDLLAIHSKQRRVVEVWPSRSGARFASFSVHRGSVLVENYHPRKEHGAFILDSIDQRGPATALKRIDVKNTQQQQSHAPEEPMSAGSSSREATMRVQHLKQILSVGKDMSHAQADVFEAFCAIKSLKDLSSCLDLVATTTLLEDELGANGASFQKRALQYCSSILAETNKNSNETIQSVAAANLSRKVQFYERIIKAYDIMRRHESTPLNEVSTSSTSLSSFAQESLGWADVYQKVVQTDVDEGDETANKAGTLKFYKFASSCVFPSANQSKTKMMKIYLSESTRTRNEILQHIFQPLLGFFSSGVVGSVFGVLGIREDYSYVLRCFGEWFMTLELSSIKDRCLRLPDSPMSRFLRDTIEREFMTVADSPPAIDSLSQLCEASTDLIRAFMLATLSREVQLQISRQKEDTTFATADISKWCELVKQLDKSREFLDSLLRKLRMCLLVSLRLYGEDLAPFPLSVKSLETETDFSVSKWLALDELSLSQNHEEIVTLEVACGLSNHSFDPMSAEADEHEKFSLLQKLCLDREVQLDHTAQNGSLLLFLASFNEPRVLAAHRLLLLSFKWIKEPKYLQVLRYAISSLESLSPPPIAYAVRLEVWNSVIAPVYRAQLFGFSDVHEIKEDDFGPLFESQEWKSEFGRMALQILTLLGNTPYTEEIDEDELGISPGGQGSKVWPPIEKDHTISALLGKARRIETAAIDMHVASVCALLFSTAGTGLRDCLPELDNYFQPFALFNVTKDPKLQDVNQEKFLRDAVVSFTKELKRGPIDSFGVLGELSLLATRWGFGQKWLNTTFLTVAYELGRDEDVDDLLVRCDADNVLPSQIIVAGVNTVCLRLDYFFHAAKSQGEARNVLGLLDAELCEWIHQRAEAAQPTVKSWFEFEDQSVPDHEKRITKLLSNSQILTIRLLSLASISNEEASMRAKIHSISVLAGTLVKALEH